MGQVVRDPSNPIGSERLDVELLPQTCCSGLFFVLDRNSAGVGDTIDRIEAGNDGSRIDQGGIAERVFQILARRSEGWCVLVEHGFGKFGQYVAMGHARRCSDIA